MSVFWLMAGIKDPDPQALLANLKATHPQIIVAKLSSLQRLYQGIYEPVRTAHLKKPSELGSFSVALGHTLQVNGESLTELLDRLRTSLFSKLSDNVFSEFRYCLSVQLFNEKYPPSSNMSATAKDIANMLDGMSWKQLLKQRNLIFGKLFPGVRDWIEACIKASPSRQKFKETPPDIGSLIRQAVVQAMQARWEVFFKHELRSFLDVPFEELAELETFVSQASIKEDVKSPRDLQRIHEAKEAERLAVSSDPLEDVEKLMIKIERLSNILMSFNEHRQKADDLADIVACLLHPKTIDENHLDPVAVAQMTDFVQAKDEDTTETVKEVDLLARIRQLERQAEKRELYIQRLKEEHSDHIQLLQVRFSQMALTMSIIKERTDLVENLCREHIAEFVQRYAAYKEMITQGFSVIEEIRAEMQDFTARTREHIASISSRVDHVTAAQARNGDGLELCNQENITAFLKEIVEGK